MDLTKSHQFEIDTDRPSRAQCRCGRPINDPIHRPVEVKRVQGIARPTKVG